MGYVLRFFESSLGKFLHRDDLYEVQQKAPQNRATPQSANVIRAGGVVAGSLSGEFAHKNRAAF
jgi:hypothetical protein